MLLELNPNLDRKALGAEFAATGRLQIPDVLRRDSATSILSVLATQTPWSLAWQAGSDGPHLIRPEDLRKLASADRQSIAEKLAAPARENYAFLYHSYPLVTAYLEGWNPGSAHDRLLEDLNAEPFLSLLKDVTGMDDLVKVDGQATLYAKGNYLWPPTDEEASRGRRVAYVLNLTAQEWQPQWGGYLNFFDENLDIELALRPRFNSLNLLSVPQLHSVSEVTATAPNARFAITGWGRNQ
jgi:Rps23 Pro-64 3,4-dihydroxylase Tpa1-like proline 4-hydroxylase